MMARVLGLLPFRRETWMEFQNSAIGLTQPHPLQAVEEVSWPVENLSPLLSLSFCLSSESELLKTMGLFYSLLKLNAA